MRLIICCVIALLAASRANAWSDHASLLWPLVSQWTELEQSRVAVESLDQFVETEAQGLERLLEQQEQWARETLEHYPARPDALRFLATSDDRVKSFLQAIRVNPSLPYALYRQASPGERLLGATLGWNDLSILKPGTSHRLTQYQPLIAGEMVSVAHVVASASDEPDFGIDIGLFEDNGTDIGRAYGFGKQPFGNPNLDYGSQAPFHMGFFHLDALTEMAQPDLQRTFPHWRVSLFGRLAAYAFERGHPYWGWRFAGWALHYIGDLTQPYHALPLPGVSTLEALWLVLQGRTGEAVQLVSNRHGVLESYQFQRLQHAFSAQTESSLLATIRGELHSEQFTSDYVTTVLGPLTAGSVGQASALDSALENHVPSQYVADPSFEWTGSGQETEIVERVRASGGEAAIAGLDAALSAQLEHFGFFARAWINSFWNQGEAERVSMPVGWAGLSARVDAAPSTVSLGAVSSYGEWPSQKIIQLAPEGEVAGTPLILLHGGCWSNQFDYQHLLPLGESLASRGHPVFLLEYRRVGDEGGGWPGSYEDVIAGIEAVMDQYGVVSPWLAGHSAGGHLALLAAESLSDKLAGVIALAAITDLERYAAAQGSCPQMVEPLLASVDATERASVFERASPARRQLPIPVLAVTGGADQIVTGAQDLPLEAQIHVKVLHVPGAGHFDLVHPDTEASRRWITMWEDLSQ